VSEDLALADMGRAIMAARAIVAGIHGEQWAVPTPCTGVDVRALVNHLVIGNLHFAALVNRTPLPDRDADHLGDDPLEAFGRAAAALREAYAQPGVLDATYAAPFGTAPGVALVRARIVEHLGHGWDLARATGQPADFPDDVVERAIAQTRRQLADRPEGPGSPFAAEVPVPADAPAIDRFAGFLGRPVLMACNQSGGVDTMKASHSRRAESGLRL
jgi:uncharacterized protein (TIGR03086 family)